MSSLHYKHFRLYNDSSTFYSFTVGIIFLFRQIVESFKSYITQNIDDRISLKAKSELYKNILKQEVGFFDETKSGAQN